jgi:hypothetical protein
LTKEALSFLFPAPCLVAKASDTATQRNYSLSTSSDSEDGDDLSENTFSKKCVALLLLLFSLFFLFVVVGFG